MRRLGRGGDEIAGRRIALRQPRAFVEQPRRLVEWLDIDLDDRGAEPRQPIERLCVIGCSPAVAEENSLTGLRYPDTNRWQGAGALERPASGVRVIVVEAGHYGEHGRAIVRGMAKHRHAIERAA